MADDAQSQWDDFSSAFSEAGKPAPKPIDPLAPLPHYPQQRYIDKNLAPEQNLTYQDVGELAHARRLAESKGVIPKELGEYMLPMAMVEGRSGNFGINDGNAFSATPAALSRAKALGMGVTDLTNPAVVERHRFDYSEWEKDATGLTTGRQNYYRKITVQGPDGPMEAGQVVDGPPTTPLTIDYKKKPRSASAGKLGDTFTGDEYEPKIPGNKMLQVNGSGGPGDMATLMTLILAEKHAVAKGDTEGTVKGYNGSGPKTEKYWAKVQAAKELLAHPKNAQIMQYYNSQYQQR